MIPILRVRKPSGEVVDIIALVGRRGTSMKSLERTAGDGSPGSTDTYTITMSDGVTFPFQIYNGKDGKDGDGTGDMAAATYDPTGKRQDIFAYVEARIADLINSAPTTLDTLGEIAAAMEENADVVDALDAAVGSKAAAADLTGHTGNKSNPHGVTAEQVGALPLSGGTINGELTVNSSLRVVSDQPVEIGRYLDFHTGKDDASDYSGRMILNPDTGNVEWSNAIDGNKSGFLVTPGNLRDAIQAAGINLGAMTAEEISGMGFRRYTKVVDTTVTFTEAGEQDILWGDATLNDCEGFFIRIHSTTDGFTNSKAEVGTLCVAGDTIYNLDAIHTPGTGVIFAEAEITPIRNSAGAATGFSGHTVAFGASGTDETAADGFWYVNEAQADIAAIDSVRIDLSAGSSVGNYPVDIRVEVWRID